MFLPLGERPPHSVIYGLIAKPWTPTGHIQSVAIEDFAGFKKPGYAKIVWGFSFEPHPQGTLVTTETLITCTDKKSRKKFRLYWFFVRPFSGWMRTEILKLLER